NVKVLAKPQGADTVGISGGLSELPRDEHDRGRFPANSDKDINNLDAPYSTASGMARIRMVNGISDTNVSEEVDRDAFAGEDGSGFDELLGRPSILRGNYGVMYTVRLRWTNPDGRRVALLLNPRGGAFAGAIAEMSATGALQAFPTPRPPNRTV